MGFDLFAGDALDNLRRFPAHSFDGCLSDPPYNLGFMGRAWDKCLPGPEVWQEVQRVLKPGAYLLAFGGTRTFHRLTCNIEDGRFQIRDCLSWLYGQGFPKSLDISKAIDRKLGATREIIGEGGRPCGGMGINAYGHWDKQTSNPITAPATPEAEQWNGWGSALKPAWEPIVLGQVPIEGTYAKNAIKWGTGGLNIDGGRIESGNDCHDLHVTQGGDHFSIGSKRKTRGTVFQPAKGRFPGNVLLDEEAADLLDDQAGERSPGNFPKSQNTQSWKCSSQGKQLSPATGIANRPELDCCCACSQPD